LEPVWRGEKERVVCVFGVSDMIKMRGVRELVKMECGSGATKVKRMMK